MKSTLLITLILLGGIVKGQGIYRGGNGGGWASALHIRNAGNTIKVSVFSSTSQFITAQEMAISPSMRVMVYDCLGRKLETISITSGTPSVSLVSNYRTGIYLFNFASGSKTWVRKVVL